jgi:cytochrome c oxidase cbb3-type subunit 3
MKSWKDDFSPKQIQQIASFVKSLRGTKPAIPKAPQGELYIEASPVPAATDSLKKTTDSLMAAVKK